MPSSLIALSGGPVGDEGRQGAGLAAAMVRAGAALGHPKGSATVGRKAGHPGRFGPDADRDRGPGEEAGVAKRGADPARRGHHHRGGAVADVPVLSRRVLGTDVFL